MKKEAENGRFFKIDSDLFAKLHGKVVQPILLHTRICRGSV